ncbi:hypothetical protein HCU01_31140 [Halomonas cupida]|uniref:Alpha/beta hydrolase fold n=1 Tax=Halomonas cupida TaxID=44933 RepID=A0ABQ0WHB4_9GAMM|nr:hypothetical protein HCU01_31140 [Halomonas cupida]
MPPDPPLSGRSGGLLAVYGHAIEAYGADHVILCGRSAGGNLAMAMSGRGTKGCLTG